MDNFNAPNSQLDFSLLESLFHQKGVLKEYKKKEYFARQNNKTNYIGFVVSGIFRLSRIDSDANERIIGYAFEGDFVSDYPTLVNQSDSLISIQASTDCTTYLLSSKDLDDFWETNMDTQRLGRRIAEAMFTEIYQRLIGFYCDTPEQRYISLMQRCPNLKEKIPLKEIASLIGVTPETVSHIRRNLLQNEKS